MNKKYKLEYSRKAIELNKTDIFFGCSDRKNVSHQFLVVNYIILVIMKGYMSFWVNDKFMVTLNIEYQNFKLILKKTKMLVQYWKIHIDLKMIC